MRRCRLRLGAAAGECTASTHRRQPVIVGGGDGGHRVVLGKLVEGDPISAVMNFTSVGWVGVGTIVA